MKYYSDKLAFITGGSSGIGLATASYLAAQGCALVLFARNRVKLDEARQRIRRGITGTQPIDIVSMDVADNDDVRKKIAEAVAQFGTPDILINSAGVGAGDYFENIGYAQFDQTMKINVYGAWHTISAILPHMKQKGSGHIVNIASMAGLIGMFGYSLYSSTKYALVGMSECLRSELKPFNISVTLVCPPEVSTPMIEEEAKTLPPESRIVKSLAGLLKPETVAEAIVRGIKRKQFLITPGLAARSLYFFHRISNGWLTRTPSDWLVWYAGFRERTWNRKGSR